MLRHIKFTIYIPDILKPSDPNCPSKLPRVSLIIAKTI